MRKLKSNPIMKAFAVEAFNEHQKGDEVQYPYSVMVRLKNDGFVSEMKPVELSEIKVEEVAEPVSEPKPKATRSKK
jgi:hypothetical protein